MPRANTRLPTALAQRTVRRMSYLRFVGRYPAFGWFALWAAFSVPVLVLARFGYLWPGVGLGTIAAGLLLIAHKRRGGS